MFKEQLKELGLTDNETDIYLILLKRGPLNPSKISEYSGLHRGYIYDALERMHEKEIVSYVLKDNKKQFQATSPKNLVELLRLRLENFEKIVPKLSKLIQTSEENISVELHKGKNAYRLIIKDIIANLKKGDEVLIIGVDEKVLLEQVEPIYLKQYFNIIKSKNIKERVIIKRGNEKFNIANVSHKFLDKRYLGNTEQLIYKDNVAIFLLGSPNHLIVIRNEQVAETYRKQFELFWKQAKK